MRLSRMISRRCFPRVAAAKAIGHIGKAIFMQRAGDENARGERQGGSQQRRHSQHVGANQNRTDDGSDDGAGQRKEAHGFGQRRQIQRAHERNWQAREKAQRRQGFGKRPDFPRIFARWRRHVVHVALIPRIP